MRALISGLLTSFRVLIAAMLVSTGAASIAVGHAATSNSNKAESKSASTDKPAKRAPTARESSLKNSRESRRRVDSPTSRPTESNKVRASDKTPSKSQATKEEPRPRTSRSDTQARAAEARRNDRAVAREERLQARAKGANTRNSERAVGGSGIPNASAAPERTASKRIVVDEPNPGWQSRAPESAYGTNHPTPRNPIGPTGTIAVSQEWGKPWSQNTEKLHTGADIAAKRNAPVAALSSGTVVVRELGNCKAPSPACPTADKPWGQAVVIRKPDGTAEAYLHVKSAVKDGQKVEPGTLIGSVYDNHLHFNRCKEADGCHVGAVTKEVFARGNYLEPGVR